LISSGMIGSVIYLSHTLFGDYLLESHNPITMRIQNLLFTNTPYSGILIALVVLFSLFMVLFAIGMCIVSNNEYSNKMKYSYIALFIPMQIAFFLNSIIDTKSYLYFAVFIVITGIIFSIIITIEYLKIHILKSFGKYMIIFSSLVTLTGIYYLIVLLLDLSNIGLAQRLFVFSLIATIFSISNFETFFDRSTAKELQKNNEQD